MQPVLDTRGNITNGRGESSVPTRRRQHSLPHYILKYSISTFKQVQGHIQSAESQIQVLRCRTTEIKITTMHLA